MDCMTTSLTVQLSDEVARFLQSEVESGLYRSADDAVLEALIEWQTRRNASLRAQIQIGLNDLAAGRVTDLDVDAIIEEGRRQSRASPPG